MSSNPVSGPVILVRNPILLRCAKCKEPLVTRQGKSVHYRGNRASVRVTHEETGLHYWLRNSCPACGKSYDDDLTARKTPPAYSKQQGSDTAPNR